MNLKQRPPNKHDLATIYQITLEIQQNPWSQSEIFSEIEQENPYSAVIEGENGKPIAYFFVRETGPDVEIMLVGVSRSYQRQGIGRHFILDLIKQRVHQGEIFLEVSDLNWGAIGFYKSLGFKSHGIRRDYYKDGSNAALMKLNLAKP